MLISAPYPAPIDERKDPRAEARFTALQDLVRSVRALRSECGIEPSLKLHIALFIEKGSDAEAAKEKTDIIQLLAGVSRIDFMETLSERPKGAVGTVGKGYEAFVVAGEEVDPAQLVARFLKEIEKEKANIEKLDQKLSNGNFTAHAPAEVVEAEREKLIEMNRRVEKLGSYIQDLQ